MLKLLIFHGKERFSIYRLADGRGIQRKSEKGITPTFRMNDDDDK